MYNPIILGFHKDRGPLDIPLQQAKDEFGGLPSKYNKISSKADREPRKVLNLELGVIIKDWFDQQKSKKTSLKGFVCDFFKTWHRDYMKEFKIAIQPLINLNDEETVKNILQSNLDIIEEICSLELDDFIEKNQIMDSSIIKGIQNDPNQKDNWQQFICDKAIERINRKRDRQSEADQKIKTKLQIKQILEKLAIITGCNIKCIQDLPTEIYTDEVANALIEIGKLTTLVGLERLESVEQNGIKMEYIARDHSYLKRGKEFGDCTAEKKPNQDRQETQNIYWTVFAWILDRNYQIMIVSKNNHSVLKVHLALLFLKRRDSKQDELPCLFVDAIEAKPDKNLALSDQDKSELFDLVINKVLDIAAKMGINIVLAEQFSNAEWVREKLKVKVKDYPEIYLSINDIEKVDHLEDVWECAQRFTKLKSTNQDLQIENLFMEIQAKNTFLIPEGVSSRKKDYKSFSVLYNSSNYEGTNIKDIFNV